jgi:polysaccharide pyruvyl transferase WcaK-like protein
MIKIIHFNHDDKNNLNIGDQAHVVAIQEILTQLSSDKIEFIERSIQLLSRQAIPNKFYYPKSRRYPTFVQNIYRRLCGKSVGKLIKECNDADLVLIGGGGVYMGYLFPLYDKLIKRINTPIVVFGVGYNHNLGALEFNKRQLKSVVTLGRKVNLQSVRDQETYNFLKRSGINSILMCDPAIFLHDIDSGIIKKSDKSLKIGINMARHGWNNQKLLQDKIIQAYSEFIDNARKEHSAQFYYFVHQPNELLYIELLKKRGIVFDGIVSTTDARELKGAYRNMDITVSMMLHSSILAFGANVPTICVGYDKKNLTFMKMTGQEKNYVSVNDVTGERLLKLFNQNLISLDRTVKELKERRATLEKRYIKFAKQTIATVKG